MSEIKSLDLKVVTDKAVTDVFKTMLSMEIAPAEGGQPAEAEKNRLMGAITFAGEITGVVTIEVSNSFCRLMAAAMMETTPDEVEDEEELTDLLGEVSNIIGGNLKSAFTDEGLSCAISTPAITRGQVFQVQALNTELMEQLDYAYGEHTFHVKLGVKVQDSSMAGDLEKLETGPEITLDEIFETLNLTARIEESVIDVFDTMLSIELEKVGQDEAAERSGERLVGAISFAGTVLGIISVDVSYAFARIMTASMMGVEPDEVEDDEIKDSLGELSNIIAGNLKSQFTDKGMVCAISPPAITLGVDFVIESLNMEASHHFNFKSEEHLVSVELALKSTHGVNVFKTAAASTDTPETTETENGTVTDPGELVEAGAKSSASTEQPPPPRIPAERLQFILDIPIRISVELGRTHAAIDDVIGLSSGSVVELAKLESEPVDILANDQLIAKGEVMVQGGKYGIRILEIVSRRQRLMGLT